MNTTHLLADYGLGTFSIAGARPFAGLICQDQVLALEALAPLARSLGYELRDSGSMRSLLEYWQTNDAAIAVVVECLQQTQWQHPLLRTKPVSVDVLQVHAPVEDPRQFFCSGANYRQHVIDLIMDQHRAEHENLMTETERLAYAHQLMDKRQKGEPYIFSKAWSSITGPFDPIPVAAAEDQPDWELELAVVIGRECWQLSEDNALDAVAGYTLVNDITNRELVHRSDLRAIGSDWVMGKCQPGYSPMGPYLIPARLVPDPHNLRIQLRLNGELMQNETTADMIFRIPRLLAYLTRRVRLYPGDILITGSPAGNGSHYQRFLRPGDVMECEIEGLGRQRSGCIAAVR
jgi:2,4-didehydro-3-deoxy-L-rhamnonate hydrolase